MKLADVISEVTKNIDCTNENEDTCFKYAMLCEDCPHKHTPIEELLPEIKHYLEMLNELGEDHKE